MYRKQYEVERGINYYIQEQTNINYELSYKDHMILKQLIENPFLTQQEVANQLGWNVNLVKYYFKKLKQKNVIQRIGTSQNGHWVVNTTLGSVQGVI